VLSETLWYTSILKLKMEVGIDKSTETRNDGIRTQWENPYFGIEYSIAQYEWSWVSEWDEISSFSDFFLIQYPMFMF